MQLVIDVGNTRIKAALFQQSELKKQFIKKFNLKLQNAREWTGFGSFSLNGPYERNGKLI